MKLDELLAKLDPHAMMAAGGLQKASISLRLMIQQADKDTTFARSISPEADGLRLLVQMMVLHPELALRVQACQLVARCTTQHDAAFGQTALDQMLPVALMRLLGDDARPKGERSELEDDEPTSEDEEQVAILLPLRRCALGALGGLLAAASPVAHTVVTIPGVVTTLLWLAGETDLKLRRASLSLLFQLCSSDFLLPLMREAVQPEVAEQEGALQIAETLLLSAAPSAPAAEGEPAKDRGEGESGGAGMEAGEADASAEAGSHAAAVLRALSASSELQAALVQVNAIERLESALGEAGGSQESQKSGAHAAGMRELLRGLRSEPA